MISAVTVHMVMSREENPELHGAKLRFIQFLCIAKRVIVFSMPLLAWCEQ